MPVERAAWGQTQDGETVDKITLRAGGMACEIITYGAAVRALRVPCGMGTIDTVLGYDALEGYETNGGHAGAVVGRYANRIAGACCPLEGKTLRLEPSEGRNQLHGGKKGFSRRVWRAEAVGESAVALRYRAADGEGGFPGALEAQCTYTLRENALQIHYEAASDAPTYCNLTNHSYFNLDGGGDVLGHTLRLDADWFTPVDAESLPTAMARPVAGTPFDFRTAKPLGLDIGGADGQLAQAGGYDHNFVLNPKQGLRLAAVLGGRALQMEVWTDKPGVQLYTANALATNALGKGGVRYGKYAGVCLETQFFPDSPNHPDWGNIVLRPGRRYDFSTEFRFLPK